MKDLRKILTGAALIVVQAMLIGLVANVLNPHGVPFFRSPLRATHSLVWKREVIRPAPPLKPPYPAKPGSQASTSDRTTKQSGGAQ